MTSRAAGKAARRWAAAAAALFLVLAVVLMRGPGPGQDEGWHAVEAMEIGKAGLWRSVSGSSPLPWMLDSYNGALKTWLLWLLFSFVPAGTMALRAATSTIGAAAAGALALAAGAIFGPAAAMGAVILFATDPSFLAGACYDGGPMALMLLLNSLALWAVARWTMSRTPRDAALAGLALGLAASDKAHGLWLLPAFLAAAAWFHRPILRALTMRQAKAAAAGYLVGAFPLLIHNLTRQAETFVGPGVKRASLSEHLGSLDAAVLERTQSFLHMLSGSGSWTAGGQLPESAGMASLALAAAALPLSAWRLSRRETAPLRWAAACWTAMAVIFVIGCLAPYKVKFHHFYLAYPFTWLAVLALCFGAPRPRSFNILLGTAAAALITVRGHALVEFRRQVGVYGGTHQFYNGIEEAARWLESRGGPIMAEDGIERRLALQTGGRLESRTVPWGGPQPHLGGKERVADCLDISQAPKNVLLFLEDSKALPALREACLIVAVDLVPLRTFTLRDGSPWISAYEARQRPLTARQRALRRRLQDKGILKTEAPPPAAPAASVTREHALAPLPAISQAQGAARAGDACRAVSLLSRTASGADSEAAWGVLRQAAACPAAAGAARELASRLGTPEARLREAQVLAAAKNAAGALERLGAIRLNRLSSGLQREAALLYQELGRREEACELLGALVDDFPEDGSLQKDLGICLFLLGRRQEAEARLRAAVKLLPGDEALAGTLKAVLEAR